MATVTGAAAAPAKTVVDPGKWVIGKTEPIANHCNLIHYFLPFLHPHVIIHHTVPVPNE
jgi:hypothetical protein